MTGNILAISYLFPNRAQPAYGVFVLNRLCAVRRFRDVRVIAPVQWYPLITVARRKLWGTAIPYREKIKQLDVFHPRFAVIPRYFKWLDAITYWWAVQSVIRRFEREHFDFDLIDVHWTYPDVVAAHLLARSLGKKYVVTVRGHEALYLDERTIRRRLVARYLRGADAVVALSSELRDKVIELGVTAEKVKVVLNGVDQSRFGPLNRADCRRQLELSPDKKIAISIGRFTEGKGHQDLIRAIPKLSTDGVELYIIGGVNPEADFEKKLRGVIADLKLTNVHLVERVEHDHLPLWYSAADVFCLATWREGCPNVVLEALSCGTPVVVTDVGAVSEVVVPGVNGHLVRDSQEFPKMIDATLAREWDQEAIATTMDSWNWARCADELNTVYDAVLAGRPV